MHLPIPGRISTLAAGGIDNNSAADPARCRIEKDLALLCLETATHRMQHVAQSERRRGLGGVAPEGDFLRAGGPGEEETTKAYSCCYWYPKVSCS